MTDISGSKQTSSKSSEIPLSPLSKYAKFLDYIWPIERAELPKFLSITLLMFCILSIQNLIRAMKDSVINTMIGVETSSFLKFWGVMPAAILITIIYVKLVSVMRGENIFYLMMSSFLGFFLLFAFYLFPNHEMIHLNPETTQALIASYPNFKWFILLLSNWSFSLFYVIAELWPSAVFALLFWQFVNKVTTVEESKRFYPIFGLLGQTGLYLCGTFLANLLVINTYFTDLFTLEESQSVVSIKIVMILVGILGVVALATFWVLNHKILDISTTENLQFRVKKNQITLKESLKIIVQSRYIRLIATLLVCYGIAINLVEGPWKAGALKVYTTPTEWAAFTGNYLKYTGVLTVLFTIIGSNLVRRLGWFSAAIITPIMVLVTGLAFFCIANFKFSETLIIMYFSFSDPVMLAIVIGAMQNVLSKSSKYTLFDSTKEMSYVPLDDQLKTRGKAAADMIGTKLGKSASALLTSLIFVIIPTATYASISTFLMWIFIGICGVWIWAVIELNKEYKIACKNKGDETIY
ncbi:MAG: ADP/ATP carrier protein [Rickettsiales bacterium]|nr:MAG: ADP/ATP carrier protein [Rickettsiales bacterium]